MTEKIQRLAVEQRLMLYHELLNRGCRPGIPSRIGPAGKGIPGTPGTGYSKRSLRRWWVGMGPEKQEEAVKELKTQPVSPTFLKRMAKAKKMLNETTGNDFAYKAGLGAEGYEKSNQIPKKDEARMIKIFTQLVTNHTTE